MAFGFLPDLNRPLRDAARGISRLADATEEALEPVAQLLPEPLRTRMHNAMLSMEAAGHRLIASEIAPETVMAAQDFVTGRALDADARAACTSTLTYAWDHMRDCGLRHDHMISETVLSDVLSRVEPGATNAERAAALISTIRGSSAIGRLPGLAGLATAEDEPLLVLALTAIFVWLISDRAATVVEEEKLLDLSLALVLAMRDDIAQVADDSAALADTLEDIARHL